jgi:hypothetical protein
MEGRGPPGAGPFHVRAPPPSGQSIEDTTGTESAGVDAVSLRCTANRGLNGVHPSEPVLTETELEPSAPPGRHCHTLELMTWIDEVAEDDWTPVASSHREPVAVVVLPDETFDLEDLDGLARALDAAGLPVQVDESTEQRRLVPVPLVLPVVIHVAPAVHDLLIGVAASAIWDGVKAAFARLRPRGEPSDASELTIDLDVRGEHLRAHARGPASEAVAEVARALVNQATAAHSDDAPEDQAP